MENAVDALKIAFAVMVFTIALSVAMATFSQARETSEAVLFMNDKTNYYMYDQVGDGEIENPGTDIEYTKYEVIKSDGTPGITYTDKRIVGIDAIIPTLYRYYKENYTVIFENTDGSKLPIYYLDSTNKWDKDNTGSEAEAINYFDLNSEIKANCPWVGTVNDIKKNLDLFLKGTNIPGMSLSDKSFGNTSRCVEYGDGFIKEYANATFLEQLGEYSTDRTYGMNKIDGIDYLEVQDSNGKIGRFKQLISGKWEFDDSKSDSGVEDKDGTAFTNGRAYSLSEITTRIGSSSSTFMDDVETNGEIIELAKPTIKRVIKYTLIDNP